jgi:alpha-1,2-mannosyltransferase
VRAAVTRSANGPARDRRPLIVAVAIAGFAFALRFGIVLFSHGGPGGMYGYDAGVYYSASDALIHGRVPYRDFVFLHPPAIMLALSPFAALGRVTSDPTGYLIANLFFNVVAAVNAVLVWLIARRLGFGARSALLGGLFYAGWWGAISAEIGVRLEPLGSLLFLVALLLLAGREHPSRMRALGAGGVLGAACCVKIWWVVPVLVVLAWHLVPALRRRAAALLAVGAAAGVLAMTLPFFALAHREMWRRVVSDQIGRRYGTRPYVRIQYLTGLRKAFPFLTGSALALAVAAVAVIFLVTIVLAWRQPPARLIVAVLAAQFLVLMVSPSFFNFYSGYLPGPLALTVAAAAQPSPHAAAVPGLRSWLDRRAAVIAAAVAAVITLGALPHSRSLVHPFPGRTFAAATAGLRCVATDSNSALILMNRLSDDLAAGCPNWIDVTGRSYFGADKDDDVSRSRNPRWQLDLRRYLRSGQAVVLARAVNGTGLSRATKQLVTSGPILARADGYVVYAVTGGRAGSP